MISTEPLEQVLTAPGVRELTLDDRVLEEIRTLASHDEYLAAAELSQKLWQEQLYDVRTIGCYLYGVFCERGVAALGLIFQCIRRALRDNLKFLGPTYKRERHLDGALRWLFDTIVINARFHERQKDALWAKWNEGQQRLSRQAAIDGCTALLATLDEILPQSRARQPLFHLQSLLEEMARASTISAGWDLKGATQIPAPPPKEDSGSSGAPDSNSSSGDSDDDSDDDDDDDSNSSTSHDGDDDSNSSTSHNDGDEDGNEDSDDDANAKRLMAGSDRAEDGKDGDDAPKTDEKTDDKGAGAESRGGATAADGSGRPEPSSRGSVDGAEKERAGPLELPLPSSQALSSHATLQPGGTLLLTPSAELQALLRELAGFVQLVEKKQYRKAGILQQRIRRTLKEFEPTRFLPGLFTDYLLALAHHGTALKPHTRDETDLEQEALELLCCADLERFLAGGER